MESAEAKITVEYDKVTLTSEARVTVKNMLINCLRPLSEGDQYWIVSQLCNEFDVRCWDPYDYD